LFTSGARELLVVLAKARRNLALFLSCPSNLALTTDSAFELFLDAHFVVGSAAIEFTPSEVGESEVTSPYVVFWASATGCCSWILYSWGPSSLVSI